MNFDDLWLFKETWGLIFLFLLLIASFVYAVWPNNKEKFDKAARLPLEEDDNHG